MSKITLAIFFLVMIFSESCHAMKIADFSSELSPRNQDEIGEIIERASRCEYVKKVLESFGEEEKAVDGAIRTGSVEYLNELIRAYKEESVARKESGDILESVYYDYFALKLMRQVTIRFPEYFPEGFITICKIRNLEKKIQERLDSLDSFKKDCQSDFSEK